MMRLDDRIEYEIMRTSLLNGNKPLQRLTLPKRFRTEHYSNKRKVREDPLRQVRYDLLESYNLGILIHSLHFSQRILSFHFRGTETFITFLNDETTNFSIQFCPNNCDLCYCSISNPHLCPI